MPGSDIERDRARPAQPGQRPERPPQRGTVQALKCLPQRHDRTRHVVGIHHALERQFDPLRRRLGLGLQIGHLLGDGEIEFRLHEELCLLQELTACPHSPAARCGQRLLEPEQVASEHVAGDVAEVDDLGGRAETVKDKRPARHDERRVQRVQAEPKAAAQAIGHHLVAHAGQRTQTRQLGAVDAVAHLLRKGRVLGLHVQGLLACDLGLDATPGVHDAAGGAGIAVDLTGGAAGAAVGMALSAANLARDLAGVVAAPATHVAAAAATVATARLVGVNGNILLA